MNIKTDIFNKDIFKGPLWVFIKKFMYNQEKTENEIKCPFCDTSITINMKFSAFICSICKNSVMLAKPTQITQNLEENIPKSLYLPPTAPSPINSPKQKIENFD